MNVSKAIKERRSVRNFKKEAVKEEDLEKILDSARWAPSSGNTQPLELVLIKNPNSKKKLAKAAFGQSFITDAPINIVVCANVPRTRKRYDKRGSDLYVIQDTAASAQNIHLMAYALGYATCWVGAFKEEEVSRIIEASSEIRPLAIIPLGKPKERPSPPARRALQDIIHDEKFSS